MHKWLGLFVGATMALAALGGCDDRDSGKKSVKADRQSATVAAVPGLGAGWHATSGVRFSAWGFVPADDPVDAMRTSLNAGMLPPRESVRIAALVNRFATGLAAPDAGEAAIRPMVVLTAAPWNSDTLLLWVALTTAPAASVTMPHDLAAAPERPGITIEFDPKSVASFRPLGDPMALPAAAGGAHSAAMMYELSPQRGEAAAGGRRYAVLRVRYRTQDDPAPREPTLHEIERPIAGADFVQDLDNTPGVVRFAAAVAGFGGLLRGDPAVRDLSCDEVIDLAKGAIDPDPDGARAQLIGLMQRAEPLIDLPPADTAPTEEKPGIR